MLVSRPICALRQVTISAATVVLIAMTATAVDAATTATSDGAADNAEGSTRTVCFLYAATITELKPGQIAHVWLPLAPCNSEQTVEITRIELPAPYQRHKERTYGNETAYFEAPANEDGEIALKIEYLVTRHSVTCAGTPDTETTKAPFLAGSSLVPVNGSISRRFFDDRPPQGTTREIAHSLYYRVESHMRYDKTGEGWGRGDALWACQSGRGNCSDFHSVFIALCRDLEIAARFEIGFPLPAEPGRGPIAGYHCWARFLDGDRWVGVDISEADKHPERKDFYFGNLPADRVMFSMERDLTLVPAQKAGPVNFLVYPYVEVDGRPYAKQVRQFEFEDVR